MTAGTRIDDCGKVPGKIVGALEVRRTSWWPIQPAVLLLLLLLSVDLAPSGTRLNTGDSFKSKTDVDNKTHTNAHQTLTSHSPIGVSIPPLRQILS